jgi:hypothetical protein
MASEYFSKINSFYNPQQLANSCAENGWGAGFLDLFIGIAEKSQEVGLNADGD